MAGDYTYAILDELKSIGRKLDTLTKLAERQAGAYDAIAERIATAVSDIPKREPEPTQPVPAFVVGQGIKQLAPPEPPIGSCVADRDGDKWCRGPKGWGINRWDGACPWDGEIMDFAPFTLITLGDSSA